MRGGWELGLLSCEQRRLSRLWSVCINTWQGQPSRQRDSLRGAQHTGQGGKTRNSIGNNNTARVVKHGNRQCREVVQTQLSIVLSNLLQMTQLWTRWSPEVPAHPTQWCWAPSPCEARNNKVARAQLLSRSNHRNKDLLKPHFIWVL